MKTKKTKEQFCEYVLENWQSTWRKREQDRVDGADDIQLDKDLREWYSWECMRQFLGIERIF